TMVDMNVPTNDASAEQAPAIAPPTTTDDQILSLSKWVPIGKWPSRHPLRFLLSTFSSFGTPCVLTHLLGCTAVSWMSNSLIFTKIFSEMHLISLQPMITILLGLHLRVIQLLNMSTLWDTPVRSGTYLQCQDILCFRFFGVSFIAPTLTMLKGFGKSLFNPYLTTTSRGKKKSSHLLIPRVRFTKLIIHHLKTKNNIHPRNGLPLHYSHEENVLNTLRLVRKDGREIFGVPIPDTLLTDAIKRAPYYSGYLKHVAEYQRYLDEEQDKAEEEETVTESPNATKVTKPKTAKQTKPSAPKAPKVTKLTDDKTPKPTSSQPPKPTPTPTEPSKKDQASKVTKKRMPKSPLQLVDEFVDEGVPGKEPSYDDEEANLQRSLELSLKEQEKQGPAHLVINLSFRGGTPMPTEPSGHAESPSLDEEVPEINVRDQEEGQARPNPGKHDEGQAGSNPGDTADFTNQFLVEKPQEEEPEKTNTESEVQSMVTVPIHQDTSSVPPMTTPVINLAVSQPVFITVQAPIPTSTTTITITTTLPPPPHPQQSTIDSIVLQCIGFAQQQGSKAPSSSKTVATTPQSMAWTTSDTRYESTSVSADTNNDHLPKANTRKDWWKPLPKEERPMTPEPAWIIPSSNVSDLENNWAYALVSTYEPPAENSLLVNIGDMTTFLNWYCQKINKIMLTQADFKGQAYEVVKAFYPDVIHLQYGNKRSRPVLLISKMKAARYPDFGLELLVPEQLWIDDVCTYDISAKYGISHWWFNRQKFYIDRHDSPLCRKEVRTHMRILSVVSIKVYSRYGYDYLSKIVLRRANFQEYTIAEKDFKNLYPSDFEDLNLLLLQGYEFKQIIESPRAVVFPSQGIQGQAAQSGYEYAILDSKGHDKEQRVHSGY
nr:hypothetical protein [Tanacetum cinerariifolium]